MDTSTVDSLSLCDEFTEHDVFHREQSRLRKFRQLCSGHVGYCEPALKLWLRNFHDVAIFPILQCEHQQTLRPQWNWPWINARRDLITVIARFCTPPADHVVTVHCPPQWHFLLVKTILDKSISVQCPQPAGQVLRNIRSQLPQWIQSEYSGGLDFRKPL